MARRVMKRLYHSILVLGATLAIIVCAYATLSAQKNTQIKAEESKMITVTAADKNVRRGQTFAIDLDLSNNTGLISLYLTLTYDDTVMKLVDVQRGPALERLTMTNTNTQTGAGYGIQPFNIMWDGSTKDKTEGTIVRLVFDTYITSKIGVYPINLTYDPVNTNSEYKTPVPILINSSKVNIKRGKFAVKWQDYDGTELKYQEYNNPDATPIPPTDPTRTEDDCYTYIFDGWKGVISDDEETLIYSATYKSIPKTYSVFYYVDGYGAENKPNGIIDTSTDEEFFTAKECAYGEKVDTSLLPYKEHYTFVGWFTNPTFTQQFLENKMGTEDLYLYGYFKYNIREDEYPTIRLGIPEIIDDVAYLDVFIEDNNGINGMVLTLDYDRTGLSFKGFKQGEALDDLQFDTTNTEEGLDVEEFKFYWESNANSYQEGRILTLMFDVITEDAGIYDITFTYEPGQDATYVNTNSEIWYTLLEIIRSYVGIGTIDHWRCEVNDTDGVYVDVKSSTQLPIDVELFVELVTSQIQVNKEYFVQEVGENMEIKAIYEVYMKRNGEKYEPNCDLTVKIKLTEQQKELRKLGFYYVHTDGIWNIHDYTLEEDIEASSTLLVYNTNHLSNWAIVGEIPAESTGVASVTIVLMPILLAIATMAYALIMIGKGGKIKAS